MDHPTRVQFTRDGRAVTYLALEPGSTARSLWRRDLESGETRLLASGVSAAPHAMSREEALARQRRHELVAGITEYRRAERADLIVVLQAGRCLASKDGSPALEVPGIRGAQAVHPDPGGGRVAWADDGDLWVTDLADAAQHRLTHDGESGVFNGLEDFLAAEELDRFEGAWWSTTGAEIAYAHVDERQVPLFAISPEGHGAKRDVEAHHYPFPGGPNPLTTLRIASVGAEANARDVSLDFGDGYLARVVPHPLGGWLVASLPRDQRSLHWYRVESSGTATELWVERPRPWVNLDDATRILSDGRVLRASETSGWRHLELRDPDGSGPRALTSGEWGVTDLVHVDEARGEALFIGTADSVLERHLYVVPLDARQPVAHPRRLTAEPGWHAVTVSDDGARWIDTWSTRTESPRVVKRTRGGGADISLHEPSADPQRAGMAVPELLTAPAADGVTPLHVALFRAKSGADGSLAPTVVWVYGGPHSQYVCEAWDLTVEPYRQALVRAGFTVIVADNRGTHNRGLAFEAPIAGALGSVEVEDQASVLQALADRGDASLKWVAITGGSYGGFMTVMALARRPDLFHAGVAWAPVADWSGYDTAYTERYLGLPATNPDAYQRASLRSYAADVRGQLLVVHGTLDENVHPRHTVWLEEALRIAGRDATVVMIPNERHLHRPAARRRWLTLAVDYLRRASEQPAVRSTGPRGQAAS